MVEQNNKKVEISKLKETIKKLLSDEVFETTGFCRPTEFIEPSKVGFTIIREYPKDFIKKLKTATNELYVSFIVFKINENAIVSEKNNHKIQITCQFLHKSKDENVYDWDFSKIKRKRYIPFSLSDSDNYVFNIEKSEFIKKDKHKPQAISLIAILQEIYSLHIKKNLPRKAFYYLKRILFLIVYFFISFIGNILSSLILICFGKKRKFDKFRKIFHLGDTNSRQTNSKDDDKYIIDINGFKIGQYKAVVYCLINLSLFLFLHRNPWNEKYFFSIFNNTMSTIFYIIPTLFLYDEVFPFLFYRGVTYLELLAFITYKKAYE